MKRFAKRRPVLTYWLVSVILAGILIPIGLMVLDLYPTAFDEILESAGGKLTTNILYEFPRVLGVKGGVAIFLFYISQPATPLIAAFITALLIGRESVRDLVSRFRFWSKEVGWKRGTLIWLTAIATIVVVNLGIAWLAYMNRSPSVWPDYKLTVDLHSPTFWFLFLTSLFFDGGGLLEETGWRGFLLPRLQKTYSPLTAAIGVGILHSLWYIPVKTDILLSSLPRFVLFYIVFTLHCILISIIISCFYNRLGGSTLIAIALHGLLNDSFGITGFCGVGGNISQQASQIYELLDLVPLLVVVLIILWLDGAWVGITFPRAPGASRSPRHGSRSNHENRPLHLE